MASAIYNAAKREILNGGIDFDSHTFKILLVTSSYAINIDTHEFRSSITNEVSGAGYTAGGQTLSGVSVSMNTTTDVGYVDWNDVTWSSSTITARAAVIYRDTGNSATDKLVAYIDFGSDQSSSSGDFTISFSASGVITLG